MLYCEHCKTLTDGNRCPTCKSKTLRAPSEDDFCLLTECDESAAALFQGVLAEGEIPCVAVPATAPMNAALGLFLRSFRLFVPYRALDEAKEVCAAFTVEPEEEE